MRTIFSEYKTDYSSYTFSYAVYCIKETQKELADIYGRGFLPYTGNTSLEDDTFYMARSLRVDLQNFKSSSENRRVDRKIEPLAIQMQIQEKKDFNLQDEEFQQFCSHYAEERFSGGSMQAERLKYVMEREMLTHIISFYSGDKIYGYVFTVMEGDMLHYWFSFYDTEYMRSHSLGKWMMWKVIDWAQEQQLSHVYIGTCYKERSLYKVRDHKGAEFFDGARWNTDVSLLKELCKSDEEEKNSDLFKSRPEMYK
ncbi:GNAT family N-acetyltransferase [Catalinimonas niigatensis]|uniref:GNAT family N-acetyltransferase n=1 Tax=Catalinimonas niigatensis TaxID=1397264 RepID=UPI0026652F7E|nr:GNAT family N-acetyltransferase [Catalinimonas niigatensis]WPP52232.1 GNAT family N-acetyltransferase [Catalinimonas niigatensis]